MPHREKNLFEPIWTISENAFEVTEPPAAEEWEIPLPGTAEGKDLKALS